jgi:hypothetical protein
MSNPIPILLIDDDKLYGDTLATTAGSYDIDITHFETGKEAFEHLKNNPYDYKGIIFDARCVWDNNKESQANDKFLTRAITELERFETEHKIHYPIAVNTGYIQDFETEKELIEERNGKIFDKANAEGNSQALFDFLKDKIQNIEEWIYRDVFEVFTLGYFDNSLRVNLKEIIRKMGVDIAIHDNFNAIRKFLEQIYRKIKEKNTNNIPDELVGNLEWTWRYLSGMLVNARIRNQQISFQSNSPLFTPNIISATKFIEELTSTNSHNYSGTSYIYKSVVFALLELLLWFKGFMGR